MTGGLPYMAISMRVCYYAQGLGFPWLASKLPPCGSGRASWQEVRGLLSFYHAVLAVLHLCILELICTGRRHGIWWSAFCEALVLWMLLAIRGVLRFIWNDMSAVGRSFVVLRNFVGWHYPKNWYGTAGFVWLAHLLRNFSLVQFDWSVSFNMFLVGTKAGTCSTIGSIVSSHKSHMHWSKK